MKIVIALIGLLFSSTFLFMGTFAQTTNLPDNFGTTVYQSNNYYYARDSQNNLLVSSGVPDFVIKTALARGGDIYIAQPVQRQWIGITLQTTHLKDGILFDYIENTVITDPFIVIDLNATGGEFINANTFVNIKAW